MKTQKEYEQVAKVILNCAFEVHKELGPGLLESVYEVCLIEELIKNGLKAKSQVQLPVHYKGKILEKDFFIDILVEDIIIVELKALEIMLPVHEVQLLTYMKLAEIKLGFLLNFNVPYLKEGIRRKVNNYFFAS
jgi:GxxExxY protein